jgi:predicted dehydrogenase
MFLTPEQRAIGRENFDAAVGSEPIRRRMLKKGLKADVASGKGLGPMYFGYGAVAEPVRVGVVGTGDEGSVLLGAINPKYITVKAIADIRPFNQWRAFFGDYSSNEAHKARPGLLSVYHWKNEAEARKNVRVYGPYEELLKRAKADGIEAIVIALPLHLHAPVAVAAMKAGLHVLTEKLMGHTVHECKEMARVARATDRLLATGHQRHYNILYDDAAAMIRQGLLGKVHHVRAQWHRANLPGRDSWQQPMPRSAKPDDPQADVLDARLREYRAELDRIDHERSSGAEWEKKAVHCRRLVEQLTAQLADAGVDARKFGYEDLEIRDASGAVVYRRPAIEELIRWRLWDRTGAGLMAELGSHQLDAAGIFIAAAHDGRKQHPLSVVAASARPLFPPDRDVEDHVYCILEFPAPGYHAADPLAARKRIGVQYASINGNGFGGYGETVLGTEGTLVLETEREAMLWKGSDTADKTRVVLPAAGKKAGAALRIDKEGDPESAAIGLLGTLPAERGYAEELEHWAWCIRNRSPENLPRCHAKVALGDAIIALVTNMAARQEASAAGEGETSPGAPRGGRIEFDEAWFEIDRDETPEGVKPDLGRYK